MYLCICSSVWFYLLCTVVFFVTTTKQLKQSANNLRFLWTQGLSPCLVGPAALDRVGRTCMNKGTHPWSGEGIWVFQVSLWLEAFLRVCLFKGLLPFNNGMLGTKPLKRGTLKTHTVAPMYIYVSMGTITLPYHRGTSMCCLSVFTLSLLASASWESSMAPSSFQECHVVELNNISPFEVFSPTV